MANIYKDLIESMGEESEAPLDAPVVDFVEWLANELATANDYITIGWEYALFILLCLCSGFGGVWVISS